MKTKSRATAAAASTDAAAAVAERSNPRGIAKKRHGRFLPRALSSVLASLSKLKLGTRTPPVSSKKKTTAAPVPRAEKPSSRAKRARSRRARATRPAPEPARKPAPGSEQAVARSSAKSDTRAGRKNAEKNKKSRPAARSTASSARRLSSNAPAKPRNAREKRRACPSAPVVTTRAVMRRYARSASRATARAPSATRSSSRASPPSTRTAPSSTRTPRPPRGAPRKKENTQKKSDARSAPRAARPKRRDRRLCHAPTRRRWCFPRSCGATTTTSERPRRATRGTPRVSPRRCSAGAATTRTPTRGSIRTPRATTPPGRGGSDDETRRAFETRATRSYSRPWRGPRRPRRGVPADAAVKRAAYDAMSAKSSTSDRRIRRAGDGRRVRKETADVRS